MRLVEDGNGDFYIYERDRNYRKSDLIYYCDSDSQSIDFSFSLDFDCYPSEILIINIMYKGDIIFRAQNDFVYLLDAEGNKR